MKIYDIPLSVFLINDLVAYESDENDNQIVYQIKKGNVQVLGEFRSVKYDSGIAYIIFANDEVISVDKDMVKLKD
ncbi:hypothetical protein EI200_19650 [Peribacillus simplex]|uniref:hypothetical protein n=1 Tax=Peribacillus simplex TaxID=1478 RepID=UPI000F6337A5|nr:hypothetical protein [Peribacillus simplex]RRN68436.1 hypothetical protein EI200_19650 [Peribacillus simplex]